MRGRGGAGSCARGTFKLLGAGWVYPAKLTDGCEDGVTSKMCCWVDVDRHACVWWQHAVLKFKKSAAVYTSHAFPRKGMSQEQPPRAVPEGAEAKGCAGATRLDALGNADFVEAVVGRMGDDAAVSKDEMREKLLCSQLTFKSFQESSMEDWHGMVSAHASDADAEAFSEIVLEIVSELLLVGQDSSIESCGGDGSTAASPFAADPARMFQPRPSIFVSHSWGDGTDEFIKRLQTHLEQQTLASVWVGHDGLNQQQEMLIPAFRDVLCQARVVFVVLTPSYLTQPNCLRELRWALDFERAGHVRVVLLPLHPAVTFEGRLQLVQDGPLRGLVFSSKEKKVKRLCPEAIALVQRLNDVHMNCLPWHELQAWRSIDAKSDWEEHRRYVQGGADTRVCLAGGAGGLVEQTVEEVKQWLVCAAPRPVSECAQMDNTDALSSADVTRADYVYSVLDLTRYPEAAAATLKRETEAVMLQEQEAKRKAEEDRLKAEAEAEAKKKVEREAEQCRVAAAAATARTFRRRCLKVAAAACALVLLLVLQRTGRLPLRLRRLLAALLLLPMRR